MCTYTCLIYKCFKDAKGIHTLEKKRKQNITQLQKGQRSLLPATLRDITQNPCKNSTKVRRLLNTKTKNMVYLQ